MSKVDVLLPRIYTKEIWERNGKVKEHKKYIGMFYISYSQVSSFNSKSGFVTKLVGKYEYLKQYFLGVQFPDEGYAEHGLQAEAFICYSSLTPAKFKKLAPNDLNDFMKARDRFTEEEKNILLSIKPLGEFQREVIVKLPNMDVVVMGFIDDNTKPTKDKVIKMLRDYKTKSENSKKDLHAPETIQLELYAEGMRQDGFTVENAEYVIIERVWREGKGKVGYDAFLNAGEDFMTEEEVKFAKVEHLRVGERVWVEEYPRIHDEKRTAEALAYVAETVVKISDLYKIHNKYFNKDE